MLAPAAPRPPSVVPTGAAEEADPLAPSAESVIVRLQREACGDARLAGCAPAELEVAVRETARALWGASRVKAFVPVLAMREVRLRLTAAVAAEVAARGARSVAPDRDSPLLPEHDVLTLSDGLGSGAEPGGVVAEDPEPSTAPSSDRRSRPLPGRARLSPRGG